MGRAAGVAGETRGSSMGDWVLEQQEVHSDREGPAALVPENLHEVQSPDQREVRPGA